MQVFRQENYNNVATLTKDSDFCAMQELDYHTAFADFLEHVYPLAFPEGKRTGKEYNRVRQAVHAYLEKGKRKLTAEWVARIIEDYAHLAPGRYRIERGVKIYIEKDK